MTTRKISYPKPQSRRHGRVVAEVTDLLPPLDVQAPTSDIFPANDASATHAYPMAAPTGVTPFDNGTTDYQFINYSLLGGTGLRVSYSASLESGWVNEVAVTGTTGTPVNPIMSIDLKEVDNTGAKTATKRLFYINDAIADDTAGRLRVGTIDNDDNKDLSGDAAVSLTNILAASGWNKNLVHICYAKEDSRYTVKQDRFVQDNRFFILAVFDDDTNSYLGAIYGPSLTELYSKRIRVINDTPSFSAIGPSWVAPLVTSYNRLQPKRGIGFMAVVSNAASTLETPDSWALVASQGTIATLVQSGNGFMDTDYANSTNEVTARWFYDRPSEQSKKYTVLTHGDTGNSHRWVHWRGGGITSLDKADTTYT